jgi:hypothetical protein
MRHKIIYSDIKVLLIVTFLDGMPLNVRLYLKFLERYLREGDRLVLIFPSQWSLTEHLMKDADA